ncbi:MAG TPA: glycosyltransferase family 4 protein [Bryobacteraceae bacterium]|nr:glycosyltransferase family 4 protein [Bryobacteraceae bacterium]
MKGQHILMTADAVGGVWTYALDLARGLSEQDVHVSMAVLGPSPSHHQREEALSIPRLQLFEKACKLEWMEEPWDDVDTSGDWLLELCRELNPDLVHLNGFAHGALSWPVPSVVVAHSCVYSWWRAIHRTDPPETWVIYRERVTEGLQGASAVAAVSVTMAAELCTFYGFSGATAIANAREATHYQIAAKEDFILSCGRIWDPGKNLQVLDAAAAHTSWPVYVAGSTHGPEGTSVTVENMRALGQLPAADLRSWYARAAVYALPACYEPFGLSVLEAALSGCALVLADLPSLRENWDHAAVFVPAFDVQAWARALNRLSDNASMRSHLARQALERARTFTLEKKTRDYLDLYQRAAHNFHSPQEARQHCAS